MGGLGPGHKSERARLARLVNMAKARAARKREPLRWRSGLESRVIEQLVWQWWVTTGDRSQLAGGWKNKVPISGEWQVASDWKLQGNRRGGTPVRRGFRGVGRHANRGSHTAFGKTANREIGVPRKTGPFAENARGKPTYAEVSAGKPATRHGEQAAGRLATAGKPWAKLRVARLLGVSHTWVNKLVKRIEVDPERMRRRMAAFAPATLEKLERAREETRRQRELGWLRGPIRMRRVKWTREGKTQRGVVWTQSEKRRREEKAEGRARVPDAEVPAWARA